MAISRIGSTTAAGTSLTPAWSGAKAGDIEIAWAFRSSAATIPTVPSGWTTLASGSGNTCAGVLVYRFCPSPANVPTGTFTGATQLIVVRYSGVKAFGNVAKSNATGTSISYPALTMVLSDGTSYIFGAGGHRTATNVNTAPTGMTNITSVSSICAVHDTNGGVSSWAGASATVNASSGHESITVELIATHDGFNKYAVGSGVTFSVSTENKVLGVSNPGASHGIGRFYTGHATGKRAFLWRIISQGQNFDITCGLIAATEALNTWPNNGAIFSFDIADGGMFVEGDGDAASPTDLNADPVAGDYGFACFDLDAGKMWVCHQHMTDWNNDPTANPNSGTGGVSYTHAKGLVLYPFSGSGNVGSSFGLNTYDLNEQSPTWSFPSNASSFVAWETPEGAPSRWNPADKDTTVALSNNNFTATRSSGSNGTDGTVRATLPQSSGLWTFKVTFTTKSGTATTGIGVANANQPLTGSYLGKTFDGVGWWDDGAVIINDTTVTNVESYTSGDDGYIAVDLTAKKIWFKKNSGNWNNSGTADPVAGTGGISLSTLNAGPFYPMLNMENLTTAVIYDGSSAAGLSSPSQPWDGATGITGSLAKTEANDTTSATGSLRLDAAAAITEANDTTSATGSLLLTGALAKTEANDTLSATGTITGGITADAAITEANDTLSSSGALPLVGTLTKTEANDTLSSTGSLRLDAAAAITEANDTLSSTGSVRIDAAAAITEANDTLSSSAGALAATANLNVTEANDTVVSAGSLRIDGAAAINEANDTLNAQGGAPAAVADAAIQEANDTLSAAGSLPLTGALAKTEANDTLSSSAGLQIVGSASITEANDTLVSNGGAPAAVADANIQEANDTVVSSGSLPLTGALNVTEANDTLSSNAGSALFAIANIQEADDTVVSVARLTEGLVFDKARVVFYQRKVAVVANERITKIFAG